MLFPDDRFRGLRRCAFPSVNWSHPVDDSAITLSAIAIMYRTRYVSLYRISALPGFEILLRISHHPSGRLAEKPNSSWVSPGQ